jgi:hypothetical protein
MKRRVSSVISSFFLALFGLSAFFVCITGEQNEISKTFSLSSSAIPNRQKEILERDGKFIVEWEVDFEKDLATFDVTAETTGYVGFGLSPGGGMGGSDIVVGGIYPNGSTYFAVRIHFFSFVLCQDFHECQTGSILMHSIESSLLYIFGLCLQLATEIRYVLPS